jgi:hypothetical protein
VSTKKQRSEKNKTGAAIQDLFEFATRVVATPAREPELIREPVREPEPIRETVSVSEVETEIETIDLQETQAMPWTPQFDRTGNLDGRLVARGRLLSRAFGGFDESELDHDQQHPDY